MTRVTQIFRTTLRAATAASPARVVTGVLAVGALVGGGAGCDTPLDDLNMMNTPRNEPGEPSDFFADGRADRDQVPGTVAQGQLVTDDNRLLRTGLVDGKEATVYPFEITKVDLERGKQRYDIYCGVCHNATGDGKGMIVQRGFVPPPSLHEARLKDAPPGHFYKVITNGWGAMYSYSDRITVEDRWRIAAYVKVLQLSQNAPVANLPADVQGYVQNAEKEPYGPKPVGAAAEGHGAAPSGHGTGHE